MVSFLSRRPTPDFAELERALKGTQEPRSVHQVELLIDEEVMQIISERYLDQPWPSRGNRPRWMPLPPELREPYYKQYTAVFAQLGYDFVPVSRLWTDHPPLRRRRADDTAILSRGQREWVEESRGLITSRADFEEFPWEKIKPDHSPYEYTIRHLPEGMKVTVMATLYQHVVDALLGHEGLFYMLSDDPELVSDVFDQWGRKVYEYYESIIGEPEVGAIFHADDLAFRTSTMISPAALRRLVFPWFRKYTDLAHKHGKMFWYHGCGNVYVNDVIEDLIDDVQIDAFHSFQDVILPVTDFKARYGDRVATLGGVDMDRLARLDEADLRQYIRSILEQCMPGGRYALGSGNTIANFIPLKNYLVMLEEAQRWSSSMTA